MTTTLSCTVRTGDQRLRERYYAIRSQSEQLCQPLAVDDYTIQSMPDVSPPKWHLAHTTWFFETFLLQPYLPGYEVFHPRYNYLFNSYYETMGARHPRAQRGLLARPTVEEVYRYRAYVDQALHRLLIEPNPKIASLIRLGLHHEQQHQELLLTDLKHNFAVNPLRPAYQVPMPEREASSLTPKIWIGYSQGLYHIGHPENISEADSAPDFAPDFTFDNEGPQHPVYLQDYALSSRLVTNGEYLEFIEAGGYQRAEYWLAEGWATVQTQQWQAPLYWQKIEGQWWIMTLTGLHPLNEQEPVCHVSFFEADAYASWAGRRLPTEAEWEVAASQVPIQGNLLSTGYLHPTAADGVGSPDQLYGDVWEWTQSAYLPYPRFKPVAGAVGEYNGKFMCNQMVLRGGSCVTPADHIRPTYRNFFPPHARWQFSGIRLAQ